MFLAPTTGNLVFQSKHRIHLCPRLSMELLSKIIGPFEVTPAQMSGGLNSLSQASQDFAPFLTDRHLASCTLVADVQPDHAAPNYTTTRSSVPCSLTRRPLLPIL